MTTGVGIAGFGLAGRYFHAPLAAAAGMEVRAVATSRSGALRAALPDAEQVADADALNARDDIDLVIVATPNALHAAQARAALAAGKHVVVDKPLTPTAAEALALHELAEACGRTLSVFQNRRWDSDFLTLKSLMDGGALGAPARFINSWNRHRAAPQNRWREQPGPAAGLFYDLGAHMIDQALALFGPPDWIEADIFAQRAGAAGVDDGFTVWMARDNVRIGIFGNSLAAGPARELRLDGTAGSYVKTGFDPQEGQLRSGLRPGDPGFGVEPEEEWGVLHAPDAGARAVPSLSGTWMAFYDGVRRAIEGGAPVPVTAQDAAQTIAMIEAAFESVREGRRIRFR